MSRQSNTSLRLEGTLAKEAGLSDEQAVLFQNCMDRFKGLGLNHNESVWASCQVVILDKVNLIVKKPK